MFIEIEELTPYCNINMQFGNCGYIDSWSTMIR